MKRDIVPRGFGLINKQDEQNHKKMVRVLSDILKADERVFKPSISDAYQKIGYAGEIGGIYNSRSYIGVTFEGMMKAEDMDLVKPVLEENGYRFTNVIESRYVSSNGFESNGLVIRFHKDNEHGEEDGL